MEQRFGKNRIEVEMLREFCVFSPSALSSGLCRVHFNNNYFMRYLMFLFPPKKMEKKWKNNP